MKKFAVTLVFATLVPVALAESTEALSARVTELEKRLADMEAAVGPILTEKKQERIREKQRNRARVRMLKDREVYDQTDRKIIEELYQVANKKWRTDEGKDSLKKLIAEYDKANRTGCALLYLGQMSEGDEQVAYLKKAIDDFSDCFYGDGVQVGPYARYYLARRYQADGKKAEALKLVEEIKTAYPDAIDHRGRALAPTLEDFDRED